MSISKPSRKRRSHSEQAAIVRRFSESGLSIREFCRRESVSLSSLQRWRSRVAADDASEFVELVPTAAKQSPPSDWSLEVALPGGIQLRFRG